MDINFGDLDILSPEYYQSITKYFDNKDLFSNFAKDDETNYTISKILYNPISKKIIGIKFENNLVVPVIQEKLVKKDLISYFNKYFKSKRVNQDNINDYIENILYDFNLGIDNNRLDITNRNIIMNDLLYHQFKFEFSKKINEIPYIKQQIKNILFKIRKIELHKRDNLIYQLQILILKFMKKFVHSDDIKVNLKKGFKFTKCNKLSQRKCVKMPFCNFQKSKKNKESIKSMRKSKKLSSRKSKSSLDNKDNLLLSKIIDDSISNVVLDNSILDLDDTSSMDDKIYKNLVKEQEKLQKINVDFFNSLEPIIQKYQNNCKFILNDKLLHYFSYLLSLDLISNKLQLQNILDGNFIPKFVNLLKIFDNESQIITNLKELSYLLENSLESKYKNKVVTYYQKYLRDTYYLNDEDLTEVDELKKRLFIKKKNIEEIESNIYTTPFDKDGIFDKDKEVGKCIFPFLTKRGNMLNKCIYSPDGSGLKCPTKIDSFRNPIKWGYCPEEPNKSIDRFNVEHINAIGDKKDYMAGKCHFPYIDLDSKKAKIFYQCQLDKKKKLTWCPTELNYDKDSLMVAATELDGIYKGKWNNDVLIKGNKINTKLITKKKGICKTSEDLKKIEIEIESQDITLDNYQINKCLLPLKKGGYTKLQLFDFARNILKIPTEEIKDGDVIINKELLCQKINDAFRKLQLGTKPITDLERANAYQKNIGQCLEGENKGGYYKHELREMGIKYFDLDEVKSQNMSKKELCEYMIPKILDVRKKIGVSVQSGVSSTKNSSISKTDLSKLYPGKIENCKKSPGRGGLNIKKLKKIAIENFGIKVEDLQKDEICDAVETKMKEIYRNIQDDTHIEEEKRDTVLDLNNIDKLLDL